MAALGIGLVWVGYTAGLYGYILFKGYNVTLQELFSPVWPPGSLAKKPPAPDTTHTQN